MTKEQSIEFTKMVREFLGDDVGFIFLAFPGKKPGDNKMKIEYVSNIDNRETACEMLEKTVERLRDKKISKSIKP